MKHPPFFAIQEIASLGKNAEKEKSGSHWICPDLFMKITRLVVGRKILWSGEKFAKKSMLLCLERLSRTKGQGKED